MGHDSERLLDVTALGIELLGGFRLTWEGKPVSSVATSRQQALLAYLVLKAGKTVSRQHLSFLFWPDSGESQARTNLRQLLHHLRTALPEGDRFLEIDTQLLLWRGDAPFTLDVAGFEEAVRRADEASAGKDTVAQRRALEDAARQYQGDLLAGSYDEWVVAERERLAQMYARVLERLVLSLENGHEYTAAIRYADRLVRQDPLREAAYQSLIRLHGLNGDRASALRVYHQCVTILRRELAVEPGPATRRLRELIMSPDTPETPEPQEPPRALAAHLPLVGREREWRRLREIWKAMDLGRASLVLITGEAGVGKTRLAEELIEWVSRRGVPTARTACYATEGHMAYAVVAEWLRSPAVRPALAGLSAAHLSQLSRVLPELLAERPDLSAPEPFSESWQRHHFFDALVQALSRAGKPLLLLIDDLQWCDRDTTEWLHYLLRSDPSARMLVVGTVRMDHVAKDHPVLAMERELSRADQAAEIALEPLGLEDTASLAAKAAEGEVDRSSAARLFAETQGNPLFVVESVRARLIAGRERQQGRAGPDERDPADALPPKVHAVLTARLAQLSTAAHELAGVAAAIGRPFTFELLSKVGEGDEQGLVGGVDELWQRRIINPLEQLSGNDSYDFTHDRLREVAYAELGPARKKVLHRRIAEAVEALHAPDLDAVSSEIAGHFERAGLAAKAIPYFQQAARVLQRRYAEEEATGHLTRALALLESLPQSRERDMQELKLITSLGLSLVATQGYAAPEAGRLYARGRLLCEYTPASGYDFPVLSGSMLFHVVRAELDVARDIGARFLNLAKEKGDPTLIAAGHFALGCSLFHLGAVDRAREHFGETLARGRFPYFAFGPELSVFGRVYTSHSMWMHGDIEQAAESMQAAIAAARELSHPFSLVLALAYAALLHQFGDEAEPAAERAEEVAALCAKYGFRYYLAWTPIIRGWARVRQGSHAPGLAEMRAGWDDLQATGARLRAPYYLALIAQACGRMGQPQAGLHCLEEAFAVGNRTKEAWVQPELQRVKGDLLLELGNSKEAEECYRSAARLARQLGLRSFEARAGKSLARVGQDA
jgi:DNA-binding SARP family transcriptional activator/tetratricopeptide (TPR) repeat protein